MSASDRVVMSRGVGILPYELDAVGISPCRRPRLFWFNWTIQSNDSITIHKPITTEPDDYGRIVFLLSCDPSPYLMPGWELAGGSDHKLPTFTTSQPKARPGFQPAGIESCSERGLIFWREDRFKFPPYQYKYVHGLIHTKRGWRLPNIAEREAMMGYPLGYTEQAWSKTRRKQDPVGLDDLRLSLVGNSWSVPVVAFLLQHLLAPRGLCERLTVQEIQQRCQLGQGHQLSSFLSRPPWTTQNMKKSTDNDINLVRKLGTLMSTRGTDVLLQSATEPAQSSDRLRTSVPSRLWKWRVACGWAWKRQQSNETEHINRLELRAVLTSIKWRVLKARLRHGRFLHLVDSLVSLHAVNKGRSSSRKLRVVMEKISAWLLLSGNSCVLGYVDTGQNPADAPSRRGQKRKWAGGR